MRIIAGKYRGKKLKQPNTILIRPTLDRFKEDLFNIITHHYVDNLFNVNVLDAFAGSGSLGIECLSRGAAQVVFVDKIDLSHTLLKANLKDINSLEQAVLMRGDICKLNLEPLDMRFSLVLMDPPYDSTLALNSLKSLLKQDIFMADCIFVLESNRDIMLENDFKNLSCEIQKVISGKFLKIYKLIK